MKKKTIYFISIVLTIFSCQQSTTADQGDKQDAAGEINKQAVNNSDKSTNDSLCLQDLFKLGDAERILGEAAHVKDSTLMIGNVLVYDCSYIADSTDQESGKIGSIYVMIEQYKKDVSAKQTYTSIKTANENHEGFRIIEDMGDEAYFHSDGQNFLFILARKGKNVLRMKVNKITSHTSVNEFKTIAKNIVDKL